MLNKHNIAKFNEIITKYQEIEIQISNPEIINKQEEYQKLLKKHSDLNEIVETFNEYQKLAEELKNTEELLSDPELKEIAAEEIPILKETLEKLSAKLILFLIPKDPADDKNAMVEIRAGTGGEEAALFAGDLYRMYSRYAENQGWKLEVLSENIAGRGGLKEIVFMINGKHVFGRLKFESGTHRVQRVPETEASGRIHTSAATVVILQEAADVDVTIDNKDIRIDTYRASGAGGQHVNKTDSAIRITHMPTGLVVACQDERSQFQNKDKAMRMLKTRLYELKLEQQKDAEASQRKLQVGTGDRSEKIRTYNFPQNRVTDHRINLTLHSLDAILNGSLDEVIDGLIAADRIAKMKA
ncbi:peptide chain release factor 1 [Candidatus Margulisiibacteriota bacterium]